MELFHTMNIRRSHCNGCDAMDLFRDAIGQIIYRISGKEKIQTDTEPRRPPDIPYRTADGDFNPSRVIIVFKEV